MSNSNLLKSRIVEEDFLHVKTIYNKSRLYKQDYKFLKRYSITLSQLFKKKYQLYTDVLISSKKYFVFQ